MTLRPIVDAHHHLWQPSQSGEPWRHYPWMTGPATILQREFGPEHLSPEMQQAGITATVVVQAQTSLDEARALLEHAGETDFIAGVVAWADLADPALSETLDTLRGSADGEFLVGIRHPVHDEPDSDFLSRPEIRRGLRIVAEHGLVYDLLVRPRELPAALAAVRATPELRFVIDHIAKPPIESGRLEPWASLLGAFDAERSHVWCKLSGMVTEAAHGSWRPEQLRPYIRHALDVFGPERCLFGSDWPVCTLAASYGDVLNGLMVNLDGLNAAETDMVLAGSAIALYGLCLEVDEG